MSAEAFIARLTKVKRTGRDRWQACCPAHDDKSPSLSVRETSDARVLIHCFGGCPVEDVLSAVSMTFEDLFPPKLLKADGIRSEPRPWMPADAFETARLEVGVASLIACDMHKRKCISEADYERLMLAWSRLEHIAETAYR